MRGCDSEELFRVIFGARSCPLTSACRLQRALFSSGPINITVVASPLPICALSLMSLRLSPGSHRWCINPPSGSHTPMLLHVHVSPAHALRQTERTEGDNWQAWSERIAHEGRITVETSRFTSLRFACISRRLVAMVEQIPSARTSVLDDVPTRTLRIENMPRQG